MILIVSFVSNEILKFKHIQIISFNYINETNKGVPQGSI